MLGFHHILHVLLVEQTAFGAVYTIVFNRSVIGIKFRSLPADVICRAIAHYPNILRCRRLCNHLILHGRHMSRIFEIIVLQFAIQLGDFSLRLVDNVVCAEVAESVGAFMITHRFHLRGYHTHSPIVVNHLIWSQSGHHLPAIHTVDPYADVLCKSIRLIEI